jgi:hypothetical protein
VKGRGVAQPGLVCRCGHRGAAVPIDYKYRDLSTNTTINQIFSSTPAPSAVVGEKDGATGCRSSQPPIPASTTSGGLVFDPNTRSSPSSLSTNVDAVPPPAHRGPDDRGRAALKAGDAGTWLAS